MDQREASSTPKDRRPALERLSLDNNTPLSQPFTSVREASSGNLQDVEVQYAGEINNEVFICNDDQRSVNPVQASHPRSSDRVSATLRIGPPPASDTFNPAPKKTKKASITKSGAKRKNSKNTKAVPRQRGARSPVQGVSIRKSNVMRVHNSPRRHLNLDQPAEASRGYLAADPGPSSVPAMVLIPATCKGRVDFRSHPNPLP